MHALDTRALTLQIAEAEARIAVQEQVLLRLKHGTRPEEVAQARAEVQAAQAEADLAEQHIRRLRVALAQLENRKKALQLALIGPRQEDISQAAAQLDVARAELALLNHYLNQAESKAPINATIRSRLLEPGDMASPDRPVYALAITDPKWVRAYIYEADLGHIKPGMSARVTIDSHPDQPIQGRVGYILRGGVHP